MIIALEYCLVSVLHVKDSAFSKPFKVPLNRLLSYSTLTAWYIQSVPSLLLKKSILSVELLCNFL